MKTYTDLEFLKLSKGEKFKYKFISFFAGIPKALLRLLLALWNLIKGAEITVGKEIADIFSTFIHGDWKTKISFVVMGFPSRSRIRSSRRTSCSKMPGSS